MSIRINTEKCVGCKRCINVCPGSLIELNQAKKAYIKYPKDCWGCVSCVKECKVKAIDFFLGADIGGRGSKLNIEMKDKFIYWNLTKLSGEQLTIEIDKTKSNQY